jgi:LPS-assembly lipoprotein
MSSSERRVRSFALAALLPCLLLTGCSGLRPVYGGAGLAESELAFAYAEPESRLEQIIVQDLMLRLGSSDDADAPRLRVVAEASNRKLTRTGTTRPVTHHEATVEADYTVLLDDEVVLSGSRRASASYTTSDQVLADDAALKDALERAAHEVAETIRLSILGSLSARLREAALRR